MNATDVQESGVHHQGLLNIFVIVLMALTGVLIVVLNPLCLIALHRASGIQETTKTFMASLTLSDLCGGIFYVASQLIYHITNEWFLGDFLCILWGATISIFMTLSSISLFLLSVDRFIAVIYPLRYPTLMTPKRSKLITILLWAATFTLYSIIHATFSESNVSRRSTSICEYGACKFCFIIYISAMAVPLTAILLLYMHILRVARRQARCIAAQGQINNPPGGQEAPQPISTKSTTTVFIITGALIICWTPTIVTLFLVSRGSLSSDHIVNIIAEIMYLTNGWLNVVIYYWRNKQLRQALHGLVSSCWHWCS